MAALHPSNPYYSLARSPGTPKTSAPLLDFEGEEQTHTATRTASSPTVATARSCVAPATTTQQRKDSSHSQQQRPAVTYRTRSIGAFGSGVYFERVVDTSPPNEEEIIIVTCRVTNSFRRASVEENSDLPERPRKRNFLRRVSTRVSSPTDECSYTALKMPRKDYKKYFARDRDGNYAGTEPEREWSNEDLQAVFGRYQDMPLRSIPGGQEFGEGIRRDEVEEDTLGGAPGQSSSGLVQMEDWNGFSDRGAGRRGSLI